MMSRRNRVAPIRRRAAWAICVSLVLVMQTAPASEASDRDGDVLAALADGLRPSVLPAGAPAPHWSLQARMRHYGVPGVAVAIVRDGNVVQAAGYGVRAAGSGDAVDARTLFSVGSVSKVVAAATTLRLAAAGKVSLDRDVNAYLKGWKIPGGAFPGQAVTLRMLMSHTGGFNVHGFEDYQPAEPLPTLLQTLDGGAPAKNEPVRPIDAPGTRMRYSGGGVTVEQLALESVAGQPMPRIAHEAVFAPLGMRRSVFGDPQSVAAGDIARAHDRDGNPVALPRGWESFPELAASGLWTSAADLGAFVAALIESYRGRGDFLPRSTARDMMTEVWPSLHGLGPRLAGTGATRFFHHGGANDSYRAWIEGHLESGNGIVILTNGSRGGGLMFEIRNALTDALADGVNPPLRTLDQARLRDAYAGYAGAYALDPAVPADLRGNLAGYYESGRVEVTLDGNDLRIGEPQRPGEEAPNAPNAPLALLPLAPQRFVAPGSGDPDFVQVEFDRDARGRVQSMRVERGASRLYFRRETDR